MHFGRAVATALQLDQPFPGPERLGLCRSHREPDSKRVRRGPLLCSFAAASHTASTTQGSINDTKAHAVPASLASTDSCNNGMGNNGMTAWNERPLLSVLQLNYTSQDPGEIIILWSAAAAWFCKTTIRSSTGASGAEVPEKRLKQPRALSRGTRRLCRPSSHTFWVLVKGLKLSYHNEETILLTTDPCYGNLK